jgi:hypothetical protein
MARRLGDSAWPFWAIVGRRAQKGRTTTGGEQREHVFGQTAEDRAQEVSGGKMGEGELASWTLYRLTFPSGEAPPQRSARGRHACWCRSCYAPWAKLGASQAALPDYVSTCQISRLAEVIFSRGCLRDSEQCAFQIVSLENCHKSQSNLDLGRSPSS